MNIFKKHSLKKQLKRLRNNSEYALMKMKAHENDSEAIEWEKWAILNAMYLGEMIKIRAQLNGIEA